MNDDRSLIEDAQDADDGAFRMLMEQHMDAVYGFCVRILNNREEAEDVAQETFLKAWKYIKRFDPEKKFRTWLFAIAKNTSTDYLRKRRSLPFSSLDREDDEGSFAENIPDDELLPDALFERAGAAEEVQAALGTLSPRDRALFALRYEQELSFEEIADVLDTPANTVRSLHRRALMKLRKELEKGRQLS